MQLGSVSDKVSWYTDMTFQRIKELKTLPALKVGPVRLENSRDL